MPLHNNHEYMQALKVQGTMLFSDEYGGKEYLELKARIDHYYDTKIKSRHV